MFGLSLRPEGPRRKAPVGLHVEALESRDVPATFTVTNLSDAGAGSLRAAIILANKSAGADTILFDPPLIGTIDLVSELVITDPLTITGPGTASIILDGGTTTRIFAIDDGKAGRIPVTISGLSLANGTPGFSSVSNSFDGGLVYNNEDLLLDLVDMAGGQANRGGAIFSDTSSQLTVTRSSIHDNNTSFGGGIYGTRATMNLDSSSIYSNIGSADGGGIYYSGGRGTLTSCTLYGNSTSTDGAAILAINSANLFLRSCTIVGNTSDSNAGGLGVGALATAPEGGGFSNGVATLLNTVIANNVNPTHQFDPDVYGPFSASSSFNFVSSFDPGNTTNLVDGVNGNSYGTLTYVDPGLDVFQNNGGPTNTILPTFDSLLINAGFNNTPEVVDQRGFARRALGLVDIGATEFAAPQLIPTPINNLTPPVSPSNPAPSVPTNPFERYAVGAGAQSGEVKVYDGSNTKVFDFFPYGPGFTGGVHVATADVTGDGIDDIITAPAVGSPHIKVYDGRTGALKQSFFGFAPLFQGGVNIAAGDVNGDGKADIVVAVASKGPPIVQVFDGAKDQAINAFYAYFNRFTGGVNVAVGDINGDGRADVITAPAPAADPRSGPSTATPGHPFCRSWPSPATSPAA